MSIEGAEGALPNPDEAFRRMMEGIKSGEASVPNSLEDVYLRLFGDPGNLSKGKMMERILDTYSDADYFDFFFDIIGPQSLREIMEDDSNEDHDINRDWDRLQKKLRDEGLLGGDDIEGPKS